MIADLGFRIVDLLKSGMRNYGDVECGTFGEVRLSGLGGQAGGVGMENSAF